MCFLSLSVQSTQFCSLLFYCFVSVLIKEIFIHSFIQHIQHTERRHRRSRLLSRRAADRVGGERGRGVGHVTEGKGQVLVVDRHELEGRSEALSLIVAVADELDQRRVAAGRDDHRM